jgi:hypothetical protein
MLSNDRRGYHVHRRLTTLRRQGTEGRKLRHWHRHHTTFFSEGSPHLFGTRACALPAEVYAQVLIESPVMRLKVRGSANRERINV